MKSKYFRIILGGFIICFVTLIGLNLHSSEALSVQSYVWRDDFNESALNPRWYWQNEDPAYWSLTENPGTLLIRTKTGYTPMYLLQDIPVGNFEIETYLDFTPVENFQGAGLTVYLDNNNILALIRAYCDQAWCSGNAIYFDHVENGEFIGSSYGTVVPNLSIIWLKLMREGSDYTAYYSENGTDWTMLGEHTIGFQPGSIGLDVHNSGSGPEIPAKFDYFNLVDNSKFIYLPLIIK